MNKYPNLPDSEESSDNESSNYKQESTNYIPKSKNYRQESKNYIPEINYFGTILTKINSNITLYKQKFSEIYELINIQNSGVEYKGINNSYIHKIYYYYKYDPNANITPLNIIEYDDKYYVGSDIHNFEALVKLIPIDKEVLYFLHKVSNKNELENCINILNNNTKIVCVFPYQKIDNFINRIKASYPTLFSLYFNKLKMNEMILREKLTEIKLFEKIKLSEIEIFNYLLNFNKKIEIEVKSRIARSRIETELYTRIFELHKFYCLMYNDYSWVNHFLNYLENELKFNKFLI
jgi:hypothetical protein